MELKLSERLQMMADAVAEGAAAADIGTDHGYLPIWLACNKRCRRVILSDINRGPLRKAQENIQNYLPDFPFDLRQGSGISVLDPGDADTVIIAGMGGNLILNILLDNPEKTFSISRFILQPRNHPELLRRWAAQTPEFVISRELLAEEDGRLCEIIVVENALAGGDKAADLFFQDGESSEECDSEESPRVSVAGDRGTLLGIRQDRIDAAEELRRRADVSEAVAYELPLSYFTDGVPYAMRFLQKKIRSEEQIIRRIEDSGISAASLKRLKESRERLGAFRRIEDCVGEMFQKGDKNGRYRQD